MEINTHVIVSCPECGQIRVPVAGVTVRGCLDDDTWSYRFTCEECGEATFQPTSSRRALDAAEIGANLETWHYPAELDEVHDGPTLNLVDEVELHRALLEPDWFDDFANVGQ